MKNYQHSQSFDALKKTKEQITVNYTTSQYLKTLDYFIWQAIDPMIKECHPFFMSYMACIISQQSIKNSKFTSDEKKSLPHRFINMVNAPTHQQRVTYAKSMFINRGILFGLLSMFLRLTKEYRQMVEHTGLGDGFSDQTRADVLVNTISQVGASSSANLYAAILQTQYWFDKASDLKAMLMEKYTRLAVMQAQRTYKDYKYVVPLDDISQIYMITVSRAIDRCDSRQGVLTTFIQSWFKGARAKVDALAKTDNATQSYEGLVEDAGDASADILGSVDPDREQEIRQLLSTVAKALDPKGCVRASLGIDEIVNYKQRQRLLKFALH